MSLEYEVFKRLVKASGIKKRWEVRATIHKANNLGLEGYFRFRKED